MFYSCRTRINNYYGEFVACMCHVSIPAPSFYSSLSLEGPVCEAIWSPDSFSNSHNYEDLARVASKVYTMSCIKWLMVSHDHVQDSVCVKIIFQNSGYSLNGDTSTHAKKKQVHGVYWCMQFAHSHAHAVPAWVWLTRAMDSEDSVYTKKNTQIYSCKFCNRENNVVYSLESANKYSTKFC